jgi:formylglycine-generating enzyme required for sulfatase activity
MAGGVWEWTASAFAPYPGFEPWPYAGYSVPYFDGRHFVLRGGSWASRRTAIRATFRNWYVRETCEVFAGVRVAYDQYEERKGAMSGGGGGSEGHGMSTNHGNGSG